MSWTEIILLVLVILLFLLVYRLQIRLTLLGNECDRQLALIRRWVSDIFGEVPGEIEEKLEREADRLGHDIRELKRTVKVMRCRHDWDGQEVCQKCGVTIADLADLYT